MKRALVIGVGWEQQPLLRHLENKDFEIHAVHYDDLYQRDVCFSDVHICDLRNLENICEFADRVEPDLVISDQCDYAHFAQAVVAQRQGLPGPSIHSAQVSANKWVQRCLCQSLNVDIPHFRLCQTPQEAIDAASEIGYPVIVKPVDNRGSFGVNKVCELAGLASAYWDALINSHSRLVLVEEFIEGIHITIDGYAFPESGCRSLALATKSLLPDSDRQVAIDIIYPGELPRPISDKAMRVNEEVNRQLGYRFGMTHSEYMVTKDERIVLIESANRGGGCFTSELIVPTVSGIDLLSQYVSDAGGDKTDRYRLPDENPVILKFITFDPGVVVDVQGVDNVEQSDGVLALRVQVQPGDQIHTVSTDANRHGFIICSAKSSVREKAVSALERIDVSYQM